MTTETLTQDVEAATKAAKVRGSKILDAATTQSHLRIGEIRNDVLVLKNGGVRAVLEVDSINFSLKSEEEQNAIVYSYQAFLNTLEFPVQIVTRSNKLDLDNYLTDLRKKGELQTNPLLQKQTFEYVEYVQRLLEYANIMQKKFYLVVPFDPLRAQKKSFIAKFLQRFRNKNDATEVIKRNSEFTGLVKGLSQRVNIAAAGLENCGLKVRQLTTSELIQLFYQSYNPETSRTQKVEDLQAVNIA